MSKVLSLVLLSLLALSALAATAQPTTCSLSGSTLNLTDPSNSNYCIDNNGNCVDLTATSAEYTCRQNYSCVDISSASSNLCHGSDNTCVNSTQNSTFNHWCRPASSGYCYDLTKDNVYCRNSSNNSVCTDVSDYTKGSCRNGATYECESPYANSSAEQFCRISQANITCNDLLSPINGIYNTYTQCRNPNNSNICQQIPSGQCFSSVNFTCQTVAPGYCITPNGTCHDVAADDQYCLDANSTNNQCRNFMSDYQCRLCNLTCASASNTGAVCNTCLRESCKASNGSCQNTNIYSYYTDGELNTTVSQYCSNTAGKCISATNLLTCRSCPRYHCLSGSACIYMKNSSYPSHLCQTSTGSCQGYRSGFCVLCPENMCSMDGICQNMTAYSYCADVGGRCVPAYSGQCSQCVSGYCSLNGACVSTSQGTYYTHNSSNGTMITEQVPYGIALNGSCVAPADFGNVHCTNCPAEYPLNQIALRCQNPYVTIYENGLYNVSNFTCTNPFAVVVNTTAAGNTTQNASSIFTTGSTTGQSTTGSSGSSSASSGSGSSSSSGSGSGSSSSGSTSGQNSSSGQNASQLQSGSGSTATSVNNASLLSISVAVILIILAVAFY